VATKQTEELTVAKFSGDFEDVTSELADEAIGRMTATDEAAASADHANYDPAESFLGKDQDLGVALR